jgi:hypothetical protein
LLQIFDPTKILVRTLSTPQLAACVVGFVSLEIVLLGESVYCRAVQSAACPASLGSPSWCL